jgi:hypothetical protein
VLVAVTVVVGLALCVVVAAEWWGRGEAEAQVATGLSEAGVTGDVRVDIGRGAAPSVVRAALLGDLDRVVVEIRDGQLGGLPVERARYELRDLDVDVALRTGGVRVTGLGDGSVRLLLDPVIVGASVGVDLRVEDGRLRLGSPGVAARARMAGGDLVVEPLDAAAEVEAIRVPAGDSYLLPCRPDATLSGDLLELSCRGDELPGVLEGPLGATAGGTPGGSGNATVPDLPTPQTTVRDGD